MADSHTTRTLRRLEKNGYTAGVVEKWIPSPAHPGGGVRRDFLGIIDVIGLSPNGTLAVQSCAYSGVSEHVKKIMASPNLAVVLAAGWGFEVWGWHKVGRFWQARVVPIEAGMLTAVKEAVKDAAIKLEQEILYGKRPG